MAGQWTYALTKRACICYEASISFLCGACDLYAGLSVLHTTRGSGGAQAGRVEAEIEGATLVVEIYPQVSRSR